MKKRKAVTVHKFYQEWEERAYSQAHSDGVHACGHKGDGMGPRCCSHRWQNVTCRRCLTRRATRRPR
jgi:hypothetical protein